MLHAQRHSSPAAAAYDPSPSLNAAAPVLLVPNNGRAAPDALPRDRQARPAAELVLPVPTTLYSARVLAPA